MNYFPKHKSLSKLQNVSCYAISVVLCALSCAVIPEIVKYYRRPAYLLSEPNSALGNHQKKAPVKRSLEEYHIISERNIFSVVKAQPKQAPPAPVVEIPPAVNPLATLSLVGTIISPDKKMKIAVIQNSATNKEEFYREGDLIGTVRIHKILWSEVLVTVNENQDVIPMKSNNENKQPSGEAERRPGKTTSSSRRSRLTTSAQ